jgi:hypothetical protein
MDTLDRLVVTGDVRAWPGPKPRMVFFRMADPALPEFIAGHARDHVRCLEQFFDVSVIDANADYDEVVDRLRPDLTLFESGVYARRGRAIANTHRHPEIPKVGLLNADGYCPTRSVFLADMDDWGVDTFFAIAVSAVGYTPDIADRTYVWPNFADRKIFHPYPGGKTQSILLSGSRESNYPWRVRVDRVLRERFPVRSMPHAGWFDRSAATAMSSGESYARALSSALIVPTCGTIAEELVRKHLEIPASGALLLTERTPAVEAAGYVDMVNCVFADDADVADKVEYLLERPGVLADITAAGTRLAHDRHSIENRDQLRQWYELRKSAPGQQITQPDPFGLLTVNAAGDAESVSIVTRPGVDRRLLASAAASITAGRPGEAADRFGQVLNFHFEPEAALGFARSALHLGRPDLARALLEHSTAIVVRGHGASHADPVEWAWLARVALCQGDLERAREAAAAYPQVRHPELDRMRAVVAHLVGASVSPADRPRHRSVHAGYGAEAWEVWRADLVQDLLACRRPATSSQVAAMPDPSAATPLPGAPAEPTPTAPRVHRAVRSTRRLLGRVARRARRELASLTGRETGPDRSSMFQILGGRRLDTVLLLMVADDTARRLQSLVARDPSSLEIVRLGSAVRSADPDRFVPWGLRSGVEGSVLRSLPLWGTSMVVATRAGAAYLRVPDLANTDVVVLIDDDAPESAFERSARSGAAWVPAGAETTDRWNEALPGIRITAWERSAASDSRGSV